MSPDSPHHPSYFQYRLKPLSLKPLSKVHIYTERYSSISVGRQQTASGMKLGKVKTEMLHVSYFTERGKAELAILREPASTGRSKADPSLHLDTAKQTFTGADQESST